MKLLHGHIIFSFHLAFLCNLQSFPLFSTAYTTTKTLFHSLCIFDVSLHHCVWHMFDPFCKWKLPSNDILIPVRGYIWTVWRLRLGFNFGLMLKHLNKNRCIDKQSNCFVACCQLSSSSHKHQSLWKLCRFLSATDSVEMKGRNHL